MRYVIDSRYYRGSIMTVSPAKRWRYCNSVVRTRI